MKWLTFASYWAPKCSPIGRRFSLDAPSLQRKVPFLGCSTSPQALSFRYASSSASDKKRRPLDGITVVSLEQAIAAPYCTRQLADLGARVIKVERPGGGDFARAYDERVNGLSSHFVWANRSKESLALDLKKPEDLKVLKALLKKSDVFIQNLAPGSVGRLGLSYEQLHEEHPSLIVCDISGYGQDGPYSQKKAYDLLVQSEAGMLSVTGTPEEPAKVAISIADIAAGTFAFSNILAAIILRGKNDAGKGCHIEVSMLESMVEWMGSQLYYTFNNAPAPSRVGASHATIYPYGPFATGTDQGMIMLGLQNEREWVKFCEVVLENPDLATDERFKTNSLRVEHRDELKNVIHDAFATLTAEQAITRLDRASIANARVNDMHGVWEHEQLKARKRWTQIDTSAGQVPALLPPGILGGDESSAGLGFRMGEVPSVGQHNSQIMAELGFSNQSE